MSRCRVRCNGLALVIAALALLIASPVMAEPALRVFPGKSSRLDPIARGQLRLRLEQLLAPCRRLGSTAEGDLRVKIALDAARVPAVGVVADGVPDVIARCLEDELVHAAWDRYPAKLRWEGTLRYREGDEIDVSVRSSDGALDPELLRNIVSAALEQRAGGHLTGSCMDRFFEQKPKISATLLVTLDGSRTTAKSSSMDVGGARACVRSLISSIKLPRGEHAKLFVALLRPVDPADAEIQGEPYMVIGGSIPAEAKAADGDR